MAPRHHTSTGLPWYDTEHFPFASVMAFIGAITALLCQQVKVAGLLLILYWNHLPGAPPQFLKACVAPPSSSPPRSWMAFSMSEEDWLLQQLPRSPACSPYRRSTTVVAAVDDVSRLAAFTAGFRVGFPFTCGFPPSRLSVILPPQFQHRDALSEAPYQS